MSTLVFLSSARLMSVSSPQESEPAPLAEALLSVSSPESSPETQQHISLCTFLVIPWNTAAHFSLLSGAPYKHMDIQFREKVQCWAGWYVANNYMDTSTDDQEWTSFEQWRWKTPSFEQWRWQTRPGMLWKINNGFGDKPSKLLPPRWP